MAAAASSEHARPTPRGDRSHRALFRLLLVGIGLAAVGVAAWQTIGFVRADRQAGLNVVVITLDTTRADHLGCYGHADRATPTIDQLAADGARFAQCISAAPSTLPSHATIMTGSYPFVHGVRHNVGYRLAEANVTLAEVLRQAGYRTAAFVSAFVLARDTGINQGFDTYDDAGRRHERSARETCDRAIEWLGNQGQERFFLWLHLFDPHFPYEPPQRFRARYGSAYVGEIAFADEQIGRVIGELRRLGLQRNTLVVLTADHGEGLGQHDEETHLYYVYDTTLSVPLVFRCPGRIPAGHTVRRQVRTVDIAPTILDVLGLDAATLLPKASGTSLVSSITGGLDEPDLPAYSETLAGRLLLGTAALRSLRMGGWKYIHAPRPELYNVQKDPREIRNLAENAPQRAASMCARLREIIAAAPEPPADDSRARLDVGARARLESLGYVGGDPVPESGASAEIDHFDARGADPKDYADAFTAVGRAMDLLQRGRFAEAETIFRRLRSSLPDSEELALLHARSVFLQQRYDDAIAIYRELLAVRPDSARAHYGLAKLLSRTGRRVEAIEHFATAVKIDPDYPEAQYDLGVALSREGHGAEALKCFRAAVRARPTYVDARVNLGAGLAAAGRLAEAVEQYREALRITPEDATIYYNLGNALLRKGDKIEAIRAYQEALRLKPDFAAARQALRIARQTP